MSTRESLPTTVRGQTPTGRAWQFQIAVEQNDVSYYGIKKSIDAGLCYEPEVSAFLQHALRPGDSFIDIGANVGWHALLGAALVGPTGWVDAFEPADNTLTNLRRNVTLNCFSKVYTSGCAVTDDDSGTRLFLCADDPGGSALWNPADWPTNAKTREVAEGAFLVPSITLDTHCLLRSWGRNIRLIKMDVEGAECRIIDGAERLLSRTSPPDIIISELHPFGLEKLGGSVAKLRGDLLGYGYHTWLIFPDGRFPQLVPPNCEIKTNFFLNVLFASPEKVGELYPSMSLLLAKSDA